MCTDVCIKKLSLFDFESAIRLTALAVKSTSFKCVRAGGGAYE